MNKKIALALVLALAFVLTACTVTTSTSESTHNPFKNRFTRFTAGDRCNVFVDNVTGVCYLWRVAGYGGGMTVMLDADGSPLIYKEE